MILAAKATVDQDKRTEMKMADMTAVDEGTTLGERLRAIRQREAMSQPVFAERLGYAKRSLIAWEGDKVQPPINVLKRLRDEFDVDPEWVIAGTDGPPRKSYGPADWKMYDALVEDIEEACADLEPPLTAARKIALARALYDDARPTGENARRHVRNIVRAFADKITSQPDD